MEKVSDSPNVSIDTENPEFQAALRLLRHTNRSVFLTGKAGTGKSTFLRYITANTRKKFVVLAPTGIAAVNVGGQTLHSFFRIPFKPITPEDPDFAVKRLRRRLNYSNDHIRLIRSLDLIIIDEISMVRADIIDFVDKVLRVYTGNMRLPFDGKQLLLVGDVFQLEPVVTADTRDILGRYYSTPYFFAAYAFRQLQLVPIELRKVYRQNDPQFVGLLDRIRDARPAQADLDALNARVRTYDPAEAVQQVTTPGSELTMTLATRREMVDNINTTCLGALPGKPFAYHGIIQDDFPESSLPTDKELLLKPGAQVVFIKNDPDHRWVNGTIGRVEDCFEDYITVRTEDDELHRVEDAIWSNVRYTFDEKKKTVEETVLGTYTQLPVKAAWALTIHKSQGLTFSNVIIDLGRGAFTGGQTYVALSRCRSLPGLTLRSPVTRRDIYVNPVITRFAASFNNPAIIERAMEESHADALIDDAVRLFDKGDTPAAVDAFFEANTLRNVTHIPAVQRLIRRRLGVVDRLRDENQRLNDELEAAREKLRSVADEYVRLGHDVGEADWETDAAIANFDRAIALFPDHFEAHLAKGRLLVERGDTDTAAVHLEAASRIHPDDWRPLAYLGDIDRAISDPARAMARYLAAHDLAPKETRVITRLVSLSEDLGDEESAVRYRALLKGLRRPPKKK